VRLAAQGEEHRFGTTDSAVGASAEELVLRLLYQLIAVLIVSRTVAVAARRLGQTDVSGEILAGLLMGPSLLGAIAPGAMAWLFPSETGTIFTGLAQLGLVLLMFQIGLEFQFGETLTSRRASLVVISGIGIVVPFALGYWTSGFFYDRLPEAVKPGPFGFTLFFAVAMSITAIPILGRIMELGLSHTRIAALTIGAAAVDDVIGWLLLGVIALIVRGRFSLDWMGWRLAGLAAYLGFVFFALRPLLKARVRRELAGGRPMGPGLLTTILVVLFASAAVTSNLKVFAIIGGFVIGVALHDDRVFVEEWKQRVSPLVNMLLLPLFFTYTGLRTNVGSLGDWRELALCLGVIGVAFAGKLGGVYVGARLVGESRREALTIATCMNTRALMELVALNIGLDLGVLPPSMFTKLVLMAIVSTFVATPLIRRLTRGEAHFAERAAA
jgi:Kef-type K+ transport system membrane component KefB